MKLLGWDTSSKIGTIVALEWDASQRGKGWSDVRLVAEWTLNVTATHSERLLWGIHQVLESAGWKITDVDLFAVGVGPGSFTGLRIGITTARSLAHSLKKKIIPVSSLAALARPVALQLKENASRTLVVAATDACKGELFALFGSARSVGDCVCLADGDSAGLWKRGVEESVYSPDSLISALKKKLRTDAKGEGAGGWVVIGEGRHRYLDAWSELPKKNEWKCTQLFPDHVQGRYLGQLAWEGFQAGLARDPLAIRPRYLRASDAELKLKAGLLRPAPVCSES